MVMRWWSGPCLPKPQKRTNQNQGEAVDYPTIIWFRAETVGLLANYSEKRIKSHSKSKDSVTFHTQVPNEVSNWMGVVPTAGVVPKRSFGPNDQPINGRGNRAPVVDTSTPAEGCRG